MQRYVLLKIWFSFKVFFITTVVQAISKDSLHLMFWRDFNLSLLPAKETAVVNRIR
jgi:hypothetical protein